MHFNVLNRRVHYWASAIVAVPLFIIICTGIVLQLKKHWTWVQPPEQRGSVTAPVIELSHILEALKAEPRLGVTSWDDVNRLDVRVGRGIVKAWLKSDWEAQIDLGTGEIKQIAFRRSDWIESIHDGSVFGDPVKLWIFFPTALTLLLLWLGGMWMFVFPLIARKRVRHRKAFAARETRRLPPPL
ncbi:MAG: PepSY domain-containing protein [Acidobacteriota bacterium]|nr:PepSY domain-containing protein [Acidobacteriota bacterium]